MEEKEQLNGSEKNDLPKNNLLCSWRPSAIFARFFVVTLLLLIFHILTAYGLFKASMCGSAGSNLWSFILTRLVLFGPEIIFIFIAAKKIGNEKENDPQMLNIKVTCFVTILHIVYLCIGVSFLKSALLNECASIIISVFSPPHLIIIAGYVYVSLDSLLVLMLSCTCFLDILSVCNGL